MKPEDIKKVQNYLKKNKIDAWIVYQFIDLNPIFKKLITDTVVSRRTMFIIPKSGDPYLLHSSVDGNLDQLGLKTVTYTSYAQFRELCKKTLKKYKTVAMEYSPMSAIPHISKVDAGIVDFLRSIGLKIVSSGDLMQIVAGLNEKEIESHLKATKALDKIKNETFKEITEDLKKNKEVTEYSIQQLLLKKIEEQGYETIFEPDTVINENSAKSHYAPSKNNSKKLNKGDLLMVDVWLKLKGETSIYADITWMLYRGDKVPEKIQKAFDVAITARDKAIEFLRERVKSKKPTAGWEVDKVARDYVEKQGYGRYFTHRLGHSIGTFLHGEMTHLDNYENNDNRLILPNHITSVEPGIYIPGEFGIRVEVDILVKENDVIVTTEKQDAITLLP